MRAATATTSFIVAAAPVGFTLTSSSGSSVETVLPGGAVAFNLMLRAWFRVNLSRPADP